MLNNHDLEDMAPAKHNKRMSALVDAEFLAAFARNLSYNDETAVRKHRLNEIAMRIRSNYYDK